MFPQFGRVVTLVVMTILVTLFTWIHQRDQHPRVRLWLLGWAAIVAHFAAALLYSFKAIPEILADWMAYSTLVVAAACFFLSVSDSIASRSRRAIFGALIVVPTLVYWTCGVYGLQNAPLYRMLLVFICGAALTLTFLWRWQAPGSVRFLVLACATGGCAGAFYLIGRDPGYGMDFLLCAGFALTGIAYWRHYSRFTPGVVFTSFAFLCWGLVWPVAETLASWKVAMPGDSILWDLPKYFVAFGMIVTLLENERSVLQREISERKRAEEAATAASRAKGVFLATMSHEVRTPMNGIIGMTQLLFASELTKEQREHLTMVRTSAESLLTVINDVLDFSKIEAGKLEFERIAFNLNESLNETMYGMSFRARQKGLRFIFEIASGVPAFVTGDSCRLRQVLVNLIGNSLKFTESGEISVRVRNDHEENGECLLHFEVADTGIGIPEEKQQSIFNPFTQADDSTTRKFGGTGLGLAISARLVDMMSGKLWVESRAGGGSTFHFTAMMGIAEAAEPSVEVSAAVFAAEESQSAAEADPAPVRVLLAEDNAINRLLAVKLLEKRGYKITVTTNGLEALAAIEKTAFDVVLMDVQMPEMDGLEATAAIRSNEAGTHAHLPIIAMTAHAMKGDEDRCLDAGMDAYVPKPVIASQLFEAIEKVMKANKAGTPETSLTALTRAVAS